MKLTYLTNHVSDYRVSTLAALARQVDELTIVLSGVDVASGLESEPIRFAQIPSLRLARTRRHPSGFAESYEVHVPVGAFGALRRERTRDVFAVELGLRTAFAVLWRLLGRDRRLIVHADLSETTERGRGWARRMLRKALLRHIDIVMVNGASGARYLRSLGCPGGKIDRLPYASDLERFVGVEDLPEMPPPGSPLRLLYVGRLVEVKGLVPFVERLARHLSATPGLNVQLTLVGEGDQGAAIDAVARPENFVMERVGSVPYAAVANFYASCDAVVMPSLGDTWGLCVNEAMSAGRPVLGSRCAQAAEELVIDGVTGWAFDPHDDAAFDSAILRLLHSTPSERAGLGRNARRCAATLAPERVARRIVDAFRRSRGLADLPPLPVPRVEAGRPANVPVPGIAHLARNG